MSRRCKGRDVGLVPDDTMDISEVWDYVGDVPPAVGLVPEDLGCEDSQ